MSTPIRLSNARWQSVVHYCGVTQDDMNVLASVSAEMKRAGKDITQTFYDRVLQHDELRKIINAHSTVERLRGTLEQYFYSMWDGMYDDVKVDGRMKIGTIHDRVGLPIAAYIGTFNFIHEAVEEHLYSLCKDDPSRLAEILASYRRVATADMAIVCQAFIDARDQTAHGLYEQLAAASAEVSAQTAAANERIQRCLEDVATGSQSVEAAVTAATETAEAVQAVRDELTKLIAQSQEILEVSKDVRSISDDTRLLSINARLEAARAGDHGRGFSVIADDVRQLAESTGNSLKKIDQANLSTSEAIRNAETVMARATERTDVVHTVTESAYKSFQDVGNEIRTIAASLEEISTGLEEMVRTSQ